MWKLTISMAMFHSYVRLPEDPSINVNNKKVLLFSAVGLYWFTALRNELTLTIDYRCLYLTSQQ